MSVGPDEINKLSDYEVLTRVPRYQVSTTSSWDKHIAIARRGYDEGFKQELPAVLQSLLGEISKLPDVQKKVEKILGWVAVNMTYSQRMLGPNAGYDPRKPNEIIQSKTGDCKDFAMVTLAIMKKAGIEAEPVLVGMFSEGDKTKLLIEPTYTRAPLPSFDYFNHIVVRYKNGGDSYIIDPGRGIADAKRLPFFLTNSWMLRLGSGDRMPFMSKTSNGFDYAGVKINTTLTRKPDGQFAVLSDVTFTGEMANFFRLISFQAGGKAVDAFLSLMGPLDRQAAFSMQPMTPMDRTDGPLRFELRYLLGESVPADKKNEVRLLPHFLPILTGKMGDNYLRFPTMDIETNETITINDSFVEEEEDLDCLVLGPNYGIERLVKNEAKNIVITDKTWVRNWSITSRSGEMTTQAGHSGRVLGNCMSSSNMEIQTRNPKHISFEQKLDKIKTFVALKENLKSSVKQRAELRRINYYLAKEPNNERLYVEKSLTIEQLGFLSGENYMHAYLVAAEKVLEIALAKFPNKRAEFLARIGKLQMLRLERENAQDSFNAAYKINPRDFHVLRLAGLIFQKKRQYSEAAAYYLAASQATKDEDLIELALDRRGSILCWEMNKCDDLKALLEKSLVKRPNDPWELHNLGIVYSKLANPSKAIELAEKALSFMKFGAAEHSLVKYILQEVRARHFQNRIPANAAGKATEVLLIRAYQIDSKNEEVLYHLVIHHARKSKTTPASMEVAQQYMKELQVLPGKMAFFTMAMQEIRDVQGGVKK